MIDGHVPDNHIHPSIRLEYRTVEAIDAIPPSALGFQPIIWETCQHLAGTFCSCTYKTEDR